MPANRDFQPSDEQIAYFLGRFITAVRSLSIDPVVVRQGWLEAYANEMRDAVNPTGALRIAAE